MAKVLCPKCGIEVPFDLQGLRVPTSERGGVVAPGSVIQCPSCGASFSLAQAKIVHERQERLWLWAAAVVCVGLIAWATMR